MKTVVDLRFIPEHSFYVGSEVCGSMPEELSDYLERAIDPICWRDIDGDRHFFEQATKILYEEK